MRNLAVVIPAYKIRHLPEVFQCLKEQTCQDFNLYVFDDASPDDIKACFDTFFAESDHVFFHRFPDNMGGHNLSLHWNRCLKMLGDEEWVWFFSDDDLMSEDCIATFYKCVGSSGVADVMRFTLQGTNDRGDKIPLKNPTVSQLTCEEFFSQLYSWQIDARMPEFILRKSKLLEIGGFEPYDLAWRSDNATVMKMTYPNSIYVMPKGVVTWRFGMENISGKSDLNSRKNLVTIKFFNWVDAFFQERSLHYQLTEQQLLTAYASSFLQEPETSFCKQASSIAASLNHIKNNHQEEDYYTVAESLWAQSVIQAANLKNAQQNAVQIERLSVKARKHLRLLRILVVICILELVALLVAML